MRDLMPDIKQSSPDYFTFQEDEHRLHETDNYLRHNTPDLILHICGH